MNDVGNIVLAVCGFGIVCCGGLALAGFVLLNITGRMVLSPTLMGLFTLFKNMFRSDDDDDEDVDEEPLLADRLSPAEAIRARAQAANREFEQKLRRERGMEDEPSQEFLSPPPTDLTDPKDYIKNRRPSQGDNDISPLRRSRFSRPRRDRRDVIGYDDDDDGLIDF